MHHLSKNYIKIEQKSEKPALLNKKIQQQSIKKALTVRCIEKDIAEMPSIILHIIK